MPRKVEQHFQTMLHRILELKITREVAKLWHLAKQTISNYMGTVNAYLCSNQLQVSSSSRQKNMQCVNKLT